MTVRSGYWIKYVAQRRVNNDGGSLRTHIPFWTAKALAAPYELESAGLLRMLDCGSDATPEAEGSEGAYGELIAHGPNLRACGLRPETVYTPARLNFRHCPNQVLRNHTSSSRTNPRALIPDLFSFAISSNQNFGFILK